MVETIKCSRERFRDQYPAKIHHPMFIQVAMDVVDRLQERHVIDGVGIFAESLHEQAKLLDTENNAEEF